jgi:hypothetical protein
VKASSTHKSKPSLDANGITKDVASLSVKDAPSQKHKNLNVVEEFKKANMKAAASFVVVGAYHVPTLSPLQVC